MKTVDLIGFQGDVCIINRSALERAGKTALLAKLKRQGNPPPNAKFVTADKHIVAHSETGHHHVADGAAANFFELNEAISFLQLTQEACKITHLREFDTHEPWEVKGEPGDIIQLHRGVEYDLEGVLRVTQD